MLGGGSRVSEGAVEFLNIAAALISNSPGKVGGLLVFRRCMTWLLYLLDLFLLLIRKYPKAAMVRSTRVRMDPPT